MYYVVYTYEMHNKKSINSKKKKKKRRSEARESCLLSTQAKNSENPFF